MSINGNAILDSLKDIAFTDVALSAVIPVVADAAGIRANLYDPYKTLYDDRDCEACGQPLSQDNDGIICFGCVPPDA